MNFITPSLLPMLPEIFVLCVASAVLMIDVFGGKKVRWLTTELIKITLLATALLAFFQAGGPREVLYGGTYVVDNLSAISKTFICLVAFFIMAYAKPYVEVRDFPQGEFFILGLFAVLGMMVMVSAHHFISLYLGLELLSLSLYAMIAMYRNKIESNEAAIKYFVLGGVASAILLYGMSLIYGVTGSLEIGQISASLANTTHPTLLVQFGLVFMVIGVGFKLGAVPFHMWVPDVYHGAPTAVTAFISSAPKIAAFAMAIRILEQGLGDFLIHWQQLLVIMAVCSIVFGNVVAIAQTNLKRMLAYSSIAHMGFFLLGILSGTQTGYQAAMFYVLTYAITTAAAFGIIIRRSRPGFEHDKIEDFQGLSKEHPITAFLMLIVMASMAGVPPFVGFWAKFEVIKAVVDIQMYWLAAVAVFASVIGMYYYLRVIKVMWFDEPVADSCSSGTSSIRAISWVNVGLIVVLGLMPGVVMQMCIAAF